MAKRVWKKEALESFREYQNDFIRKHYQAYTIRFVKEDEKEMIDFLKTQDNLTDYIRQLILADMKKKKK